MNEILTDLEKYVLTHADTEELDQIASDLIRPLSVISAAFNRACRKTARWAGLGKS